MVLKRDRKMGINRGMLLFNGAGALIFLAIVSYTVSDYFTVAVVPTCSVLYPGGMQLALDTVDGTVLSPIELQSRAGAGEWGVLENAEVVKLPGAPTPSVLEVKLARPVNSGPDGVNIAGVNMSWMPRKLSGAKAGCLSYSLFLPDGFTFPDGGSLPGLFGGPRPDTVRTPTGPLEVGFYSRLVWNRNGALEVANRVTGPNGSAGSNLSIDRFVMPRGRWVAVQQELVLNSADGNDGSVRVWIDGKLQLEKKELFWRKGTEPQISGVLLDVTSQVAENAPSLRLSAPVIGWQ